MCMGKFSCDGMKKDRKMVTTIKNLLVSTKYLVISDHNTAFFGHLSSGRVKVNFTCQNSLE